MGCLKHALHNFRRYFSVAFPFLQRRPKLQSRSADMTTQFPELQQALMETLSNREQCQKEVGWAAETHRKACTKYLDLLLERRAFLRDKSFGGGLDEQRLIGLDLGRQIEKSVQILSANRHLLTQNISRRLSAETEVEAAILDMDAYCSERIDIAESRVLPEPLDYFDFIDQREEINRHIRVQYSIAKTELAYAREREEIHLRIWKSERILALGTPERRNARIWHEIARMKCSLVAGVFAEEESREAEVGRIWKKAGDAWLKGEFGKASIE